ncbi:MAG: shikimate dehydrogenase [Cyanobacteriota bacterium]
MVPPEPMATDGATALLGVLGDPVRHSLSPAMHNAALRELGLNWVYLALPVPAGDLATVLRALEVMGCRGLSVTIPHKQAVASLVRELHPLAERIGAVNTLVPHLEGGWIGTNTDAEGFLAPLRRDSQVWEGRRAVVLGCGGSARAVVAGLVELGLEAITVAARRRPMLEAFAADCRAFAPQLQTLEWPAGQPGTASPLRSALAQADLVVNTTPVGMASAQDPNASGLSPLTAEALDALTPGTVVYDLIYTPRPTRLLQLAQERGCRTHDGLEMLVQQGAAALRLWSGREEVPVATMRAAVLARLPGV